MLRKCLTIKAEGSTCILGKHRRVLNVISCRSRKRLSDWNTRASPRTEYTGNNCRQKSKRAKWPWNSLIWYLSLPNRMPEYSNLLSLGQFPILNTLCNHSNNSNIIIIKNLYWAVFMARWSTAHYNNIHRTKISKWKVRITSCVV